MSNAAILSPHVSDAAVLTVSSEVSTLPGSNLLTPEAWQLWRATANSVRLTFDFGDVVPISAIGMISLVHSPSARWRALHGYTVNDLIYSPNVALDWTLISGAGLPNRTLYPNWRRVAQFSEVSCGALAVEIDDPSLGGVLQAWRFMAGRLFQPTGNVDHELGRPIDSADVQDARFSGGRAIGARGRVPGKAFQWSALTRAEADHLEDIARQCGNWRDVLFMLDPADTDRLQRDSVLGPFAPGSPDIADVAMWPGDGLDLQMSRASGRIIESNA